MSLSNTLSMMRGKTPDQIAEMGKRRGIRGRMGTTYGCPMALLLGGENTGDFVIGRRYIVRRSGKNIERTRTPASVAAFVRKFDVGGYPDLIAPPPRCLAPRGPKRKTYGEGKGRTRPPIKNHIAKLVGRFNEK